MLILLTQTFDPKKRIPVEDALAHPYLEAYVSNIVFIRDRYSVADPMHVSLYSTIPKMSR